MPIPTDNLHAFHKWTLNHSRERTAKAYIIQLKKLDFNISLVDMDEDELMNVINHALKSRGSNMMLCAIRNYMRFLYEIGENVPIDRNNEILKKMNSVKGNIYLPKGVEKGTTLTHDDIRSMYLSPQKLINMIKMSSEEYKLQILVVYDLGCRIGEFIDNVGGNYESKYMPLGALRIPGDISKSGKTRTPRFMIPDSKMMVDRWISDREIAPSDLIFPHNYNKVYRYYRNFLEKTLGIPVRPHWLRHTRITHLASNMESLDLANRVGHKNLNQTEAYIRYSKNEEVMSLEQYILENDLNLSEILGLD